MGIELAAFDIQYKPRTAIKSQVMADFVADWTEAMESTPLPDSQYWIMHFDGSKMKEGSGAGVVLKSPKGDKLSYVLRDRKSTRLNSSHRSLSRMPSSA